MTMAPPDVPTIHVAGGWETLLEGPARQALERSALPGFIPRQRWFGGKARRLAGVRVVDWARLPAGAGLGWLTVCATDFDDGTSDRYCLALGVTAGPEGAGLVESLPAWVLARLTGPGGEAVLHDALADDGFCAALLAAVGAGSEFPTQAGRVRAFPTAAYPHLRGHPATVPAVTRGPPTSSNSLVFYGGRLLLKLFRRLEVGVNPDFEVSRFLTEESPFDRVPQVAGAIEYQRPASGPVTLGMFQARVANEGDAWHHAQGELARYFERVTARAGEAQAFGPEPPALLDLAEADRPPPAFDLIGPYREAAATLGRRTGQLHLALARPTPNPAFTPEPLTAADLAALRTATVEQGRHALAALGDNLDRLGPGVGPAARRLLDHGPAALARLVEVAPVAVRADKIRCHGDYHLGQVLRVDDDFFILDFEGEPTRPIEERRAKQSPLKDLAGMLRSFHYAAYAALFAFTADRPADFNRLEPWAELWYRGVAAAFLRAYVATVGTAPFLPAGRDQFTGLLELYLLDKAFYELAYELNNRPDWVRIPLGGVLAQLERGPGRGEGGR
jgi:maltose alpha-D-glucosyltransferase/alpha-amylase